MDSEQITLHIIDNIDCPLYEKGECFTVSRSALVQPKNKPVCLILTSDLLKNHPLEQHHLTIRPETDGSNLFPMTCSGCTGRLSLSLPETATPSASNEDTRVRKNIAGILSNFSIFKSLDENQIEDIISFIRLAQFTGGQFILKKGEPVGNLYIVLSGKVEVTGDDGMIIAILQKGEVFGEMSLLSGKSAGAFVRARESAKVLFFPITDFRRLMNRFPSLQMYLARLLTKRLAKTNIARSEEFASGMRGSLVDTPTAELCQIINMNRKTGVLTLNLSNDTAKISFRDGNIITATYGDKTGKEAFFKILKDTKGIFKFSSILPPEDVDKPVIANFMNLLLEGVSRLDEETISP